CLLKINQMDHRRMWFHWLAQEVSLSLYENLWSILSESNLPLPCWSTIRRQISNLRSMLNLEIRESKIVLFNKAFTLSLNCIIGRDCQSLCFQSFRMLSTLSKGKAYLCIIPKLKVERIIRPRTPVGMELNHIKYPFQIPGEIKHKGKSHIISLSLYKITPLTELSCLKFSVDIIYDVKGDRHCGYRALLCALK
ncbi:hypothetical protein VP01_2528g1, partial [Puccinia sorghi]